MNKKSTGLLLSILGVISLVLITAGVTYAFFSYTKEGVTENTISTGTITFYYDEKEGEGNGIQITDAMPMSDTDGKALTDTFNFNVSSTVSGDVSIPYEVTARKASDSTLAEDQVKLYLTSTGSETAGTNSTVAGDGTVNLYSALTPSTIAPTGTVEKTIYTGTVPANTSTYSQDFTLRMWIKGANEANGDEADYSPYEFVLKTAATGTSALNADTLIGDGNLITSNAYYDLDADTKANYERIAYVNETTREIYTVSQSQASGFTAGEGFVAGEQFYSLNGQEFSVTINVYAGAKVVSVSSGE